MKKLKERLRRVADKLAGLEVDLATARRRHKIWREHAEVQHAKQLSAERNGHPLRSAAFERRARRSHIKAIYWKGKVRRHGDAIEQLEAIEADLEAELADWLKRHGVRFEGENRIRGGTAPQRSRAAQARAMLNYREGRQPGYYSMSGGPRDYAHALYHYAPGRIWDCSTYADGLKFVTGDPSPSGPDGFTQGGYTGTELEHGKRVKPIAEGIEIGDLVVYLRYPGDGIGHHVEVVYDPERKVTSGHGDEAIDIGCNGSWDLFGDGLYVIVRPPRARRFGVHP